MASRTSCVPGPLNGGWGVAHLLRAFGLSRWPLAVSHRARGWWTLVSATGVSCLPVSVCRFQCPPTGLAGATLAWPAFPAGIPAGCLLPYLRWALMLAARYIPPPTPRWTCSSCSWSDSSSSGVGEGGGRMEMPKKQGGAASSYIRQMVRPTVALYANVGGDMKPLYGLRFPWGGGGDGRRRVGGGGTKAETVWQLVLTCSPLDEAIPLVAHILGWG